MIDSIKVFICSECSAGFASEDDLRDHWDLFNRRREIDPLIDDHDGAEPIVDEIKVGCAYPWYYSPSGFDACRFEVALIHRTTSGGFCISSARAHYPLASVLEHCWPPDKLDPEERVRIALADLVIGRPTNDGPHEVPRIRPEDGELVAEIAAEVITRHLQGHGRS